MARDTNRYALFVQDDENVSPQKSPAVDPASNPFLNQVADDSIPWQEVKKRGVSTEAPAARKMLVVKGPNPKPVLTNVNANANGASNRGRTVSMSTDRTVSGGSAIFNSTKAFDPRENWCGVCNIKFNSKTALQTHVKQSADHQHYCNLCKRVFKDRNGLRNHVDNAAGHDTFCNLCYSAFQNTWALKNHFENNYQVDHKFVCLTCLLGFNSEAALERHLQSAEKHTWCATCNRRFRSQDERDEHWRMTEKHRHCLQPGCAHDFPTKTALRRHLAEDHFQCEGCKSILPSQTKLNQHLDTCSFAVPCPQCARSFAGQIQLRLHLEHCFVCAECDFRTSSRIQYDIHMTSHTAPTLPCPLCTHPLSPLPSLIQHLESGSCTRMIDPAQYLECLGKWWYSPLYMDLDIHAQIRTGRIDLRVIQDAASTGTLHMFVCRAERCEGRTFALLSELVRHWDEDECVWGTDSLNLEGLEGEIRRVCG